MTEEQSIYDYLEWQRFNRNIIFFVEEITRYEIENPIMHLLEMEQKKDVAEITIYLNSPGGDAYAAFGLYDVIKHVQKSGIKIKIVCFGISASAAAMILLQAADERIATENVRFLLHEISRWAFFSHETTSELSDELNEMKILEDNIVSILVKKCDQAEKTVRALIKRKEVWFSAKEALKFGLIDKII